MGLANEAVMNNKVNYLLILLVILETAMIAVFLPNIYLEITNPPKINTWYEAVIKEDLSGLNAESAFYKLSRYGFRVDSIKQTQNNGQRVVLEAPYDQGLTAFFRIRIPFQYLVETNDKGVVVSYGILK